MRIVDHPILGKLKKRRVVKINVNGRTIGALEGEPVASALWANGIKVFRLSEKYHEPRGIFCAIGLCTSCIMTVDDIPNVRTCNVLVKDGMTIKVSG